MLFCDCIARRVPFYPIFLSSITSAESKVCYYYVAIWRVVPVTTAMVKRTQNNNVEGYTK